MTRLASTAVNAAKTFHNLRQFSTVPSMSGVHAVLKIDHAGSEPALIQQFEVRTDLVRQCVRVTAYISLSASPLCAAQRMRNSSL